MASPERSEALTGAVLAGGASSRMGRPKALVPLRGRPLASYAVGAIEGAGLEAVLVAKASSELPDLGLRLLAEPERPRHPLHGIVAALHQLQRPLVVVACDMPCVPSALVGWLAGLERPLVVCEAGGRTHPLLGRYTPELAAPLAAAVEAGAPARAAVAALEPLLVGEDELARFGDPERICFNVNSPEDLELADRLVGDDPRS